jgi:hypothetical protein
MAVDYTKYKNFNKPSGEVTFERGSDKKNQNKYSTKFDGGGVIDNLMFPANLGTIEMPHYMVFYVNDIATSKRYEGDKGKDRISTDSPVYMQKGSNAGLSVIANEVAPDAGAENSGPGTASAVGGTLGAMAGAVAKGMGGAVVGGVVGAVVAALPSVYRKYVRLKNIIALPMPEQLPYSLTAQWDIDKAEMLTHLAGAGAQLYKEGISDKTIPDAIKTAADFTASKSAGSLSKSAVNSRKEVLFNDMMSRGFDYQWTLFPKSPEEAKAIWDIVQMFKLYMMPEKNSDSFAVMLNFPAMFDIEFHSYGNRNDWLYKTSSCALTNMNINFTPGGSWSALMNPLEYQKNKNSPQGSPPIGITLNLTFLETETMIRDRIDRDGNYTFNRGDDADPNAGTF